MDVFNFITFCCLLYITSWSGRMVYHSLRQWDKFAKRSWLTYLKRNTGRNKVCFVVFSFHKLSILSLYLCLFVSLSSFILLSSVSNISFLSISLAFSYFLYFFLTLSLCLFVCLSSLSLSFCLSICLCICLCLCLSFSLSNIFFSLPLLKKIQTCY